jgi:hypothetical protein
MFTNTPGERDPSTHQIGGCVGPRASQDTVETSIKKIIKNKNKNNNKNQKLKLTLQGTEP